MSIELTSAMAGPVQWEPERRLTLSAARRRSAIVKVLRIIFILMAAAIIAVVIAYIVASSNQPTPEPQPAPVQQAKEDETRIIKPKFTGHDDTGRAYVVVADSAVRRTDVDDTTDLISPQLDFNTNLEQTNVPKVSAERGVYDASNKILDLYEQVQLGAPNGYVYETNHARILIAEDRIIGDQQVKGQGPLGSIRADSYEIANGGDRLYFRGRVQTRISTKKETKGEDE